MVHLKRAVLLSWGVLVVLGSVGLAAYSVDPGAPPEAPERWPLDASPDRAGEVLLFAHALCPCTQATLTEFARWRARSERGARLRVVLWVDATNDAFDASRLRDRAVAMDGVEVVEDPGGELADAFGVATSGTLVAYDGAGRLRFQGGLTVARGHEGTSPAVAALEAALAPDADGPTASAPVFGCSLLTPAEAAP